VRLKVDQRAGQRSLPHLGITKAEKIELKPKTDEQVSPVIDSANSAAGLASRDDASRYESAVVRDTVTSHMRDLPARYGISVKPSGRFPSERLRPDGSLETETPAEARHLAMTSLRWWCLTVLPRARLHTRLCRPKESTCVPQRHWLELCTDELMVDGGVVWSYDWRRAAHFSASAASDWMREHSNIALARQAFFSGFTGVSHFTCDLRWVAGAEDLTVNMHAVHNFTVVMS